MTARPSEPTPGLHVGRDCRVDLTPIGRNFAVIRLLIVAGAILSGFLVRLFFIDRSPEYDRYIDLNIYQSSGFLTSLGIDPYDPSCRPDVRARLRAMQEPYNPWVCATQERWDYYAGGNLPLSQFYYAAIAKLAGSNPHAWRIVFALSDSLLSGFGAWYILRFWPRVGFGAACSAAFALGALSPLLIAHGTVLPEDKGGEILLMLLAMAACRSERAVTRLGIGPLLLGASIGFKLLGVFIVPLCLFWALRLQDMPRARVHGEMIFRGGVFLLVTLTGALAGCLPFGLSPLRMILHRIGTDATVSPIHASMWRYFAIVFPDSWPVIRITFLALVAVALLYALVRRRAGLPVVTALALLVTTTAVSLGGAMSRTHIGIAIALFILGEYWEQEAMPLLKAYVLGGLVILCRVFIPWNRLLGGIGFVDGEYLDSLVSLAFVLLAFGTFVTVILPRRVRRPATDGVVNR